MKNCDTLFMYHSLNERLIEEYLTLERNKGGVLGLPMSNFFAISQQMYGSLNREYSHAARACIVQNETQVAVSQCGRKLQAMRDNIAATSEDVWAKNRFIRWGAAGQLVVAEKNLETV